MSKIKKHYPKETKFQAALAMVKGEQTIAEISQKFSVHQSVLHRWKQELIKKAPRFSTARTSLQSFH